MSMYRIRHGKKRWRTRWPWRWLYPLKIDERFCSRCGLPYHNGPLPQEVKRFTRGNVGAFIFPAGSWGRGAKYVIRVGRWKSAGRDFSFSEYIPSEDMRDLAAVLRDTHAFLNPPTAQRLNGKRVG